MNTFMFDFNTGKTVTNPIEGITHFYVSPYVIPDVWAVLNLSDKIKIDNIDMDLVIEGRSKLPVIVMPFSILNLGKCMIKTVDPYTQPNIAAFGCCKLRLFLTLSNP